MKNITQTVRTYALLLIAILLTACTQEPGSGSTSNEAKAPTGPEPLSAVVQCDTGTFVIRLRPDLAPLSVTNFCNLVDRGFYHGLEVANANAVGRSIGYTPVSPNYELPQEYSSELFFNRPGIVAWTFVDTPAATEKYTPHPTRFFLTIKPQEQWNLQYTPFGIIEEGQDVVDAMEKGTWIRSVRINGDPTWLNEQYAAQIAEWNQALDNAGHFRAGERPSNVNSN